MDTSHLDALELRLSHERGYLAACKTEQARTLHKVWIAQVEKEIALERQLLGLADDTFTLTDDELLAELTK